MMGGERNRDRGRCGARLVGALVWIVAAGVVGCSASNRRVAGQPAPTASAATSQTQIASLQLSNESLNVDRIAVRDAIYTPDGNRDLVFVADVVGPADALYLVTTTAKGEPLQGFRADTIAGHEELPSELGSVVDVGRLTVWIAVEENGKFINDGGGALGTLPDGPHHLTLYVPNTGMLREGSHLRLYARTPAGMLVAGPVITY